MDLPEPLILIIDAHALVASAMSIALRQAGFKRVVALDPDALTGERTEISGAVAVGDIVILGLLYGDGRTLCR